MAILYPAPSSSASRIVAWIIVTLGITLSACHKSAGTTTPPVEPTVHPELLRIEYGRLVNVYGLQQTAEGSTIVLFASDVLVGPEIQDERETNEPKSDEQILYDFFGSNPDTLQPRLLITRDMASEEFRAAFAAVDDSVREIAPMRYGTNAPGIPFAVVPRNAALRLTFSTDIGVDDDFFVERNSAGRIIGLRNTEAVQLLEITGNPESEGGLRPLTIRVTPRGRQLIIDPVLLGSEGLQYQTRNRATGMPEAADQTNANMRLALALDGPLAIEGLREPGGMTGNNNSSRLSIIRDFRSGNRADSSSDMSNGFIRDPLPLRLVGEIPMYLENVERINAFTQEITVFKNNAAHDIDRGDVLRFLDRHSGTLFASSEVVVDPNDDREAAGVQHVRVRIRNVPDLETIDPRNLPNYPSSLSEREAWLVQHAPRVICVAEFFAGDGGLTTGDDPRNFLTFTPTPLPNVDGSAPAANEHVSPFAGAIIQLTKPADMATVRWADTLFFAMRDLISPTEIEDFVASRPNNNGGFGMESAHFNDAKYRTPYLIAARVFDEDDSATTLRLQPTAGFYLDDAMRNAATGTDFRYFLHLIANSADGGIHDLAGNPLDLQGSTAEHNSNVVIPFTVDTRISGSQPFFADNLAISVVRRFANRDEDTQPSYFLGDEVPAPGVSGLATAHPLDDLFGGFVYIDGKLQARPTARMTQVADNRNQAPVAPQSSVLRWCPELVGGEKQHAENTASNMFGLGIQNPINPYGCRLQTLWREIDLSLSRTDPFEFNLDIEQMYWAPLTSATLSYDEFDRVSMFLGHSEYRPAPCVGDFSGLPSLPESGLKREFQKNFVWNPAPTGTGAQIESQPTPHPAYVDQQMTINPATVTYEVTGLNRYLPLPEFQRPYFVFRDETVVEQGCNSGRGRDTVNTIGDVMEPYLISPFNNGLGRLWITDDNTGASGPWRSNTFWNQMPNFQLGNTTQRDHFTGGLTGSIALPLLADFWTYPDSSELPLGNGYIASGVNGWQVAVTVMGDYQPSFRAYSGGHGGPAPLRWGPGDPEWNIASGAFDLSYQPINHLGQQLFTDNTLYWIMIDMLKRQSVITNGFVDLNNPHRVPEGFSDPRLGPYYLAGGESTRPHDIEPTFTFEFDPPLSQQPGGTSIVTQFRAASAVDPSPWYWQRWMMPSNSTLYPAPIGEATPGYTSDMRAQSRPDQSSFPLDPYIAGDAHIRKWDTRQGRTSWTHFYNRTVTSYVTDPNRLFEQEYTGQYTAPGQPFAQGDIRYVNWRFVMSNNVEATPPIMPTIDSFALSWRFQQQ